MEPADPRLGAGFALHHRCRAEMQVEIRKITKKCLLLIRCPGGSGQADLPDCGRDSGTLRQELWERVRPRLPPQLQQGRSAVEILEEPTGEHGELARGFSQRNVGQDGPGGRWRRAIGEEMSQEDGKSAAETCDSVIEQSDGRKNRRKGQAKERKLCFFFV